ncbi:MAG: DEAD/DEAH box helicase [Actinomycetota bacterium]|nr:DEAD/DEAH box helicase [Actinomycetota bacterium]
MSFESLGLEPRLLSAVDKMGYTDPTPIQRDAIPHVLEGRDVVGVAQTGTGKTAAFVLPMLQRTPTRRGIRALVITPTRELATQIADVTREASRSTGHRSVVIFGGVGQKPQKDALRRGVDVVIACPGRLLDLHSQGAVDLSQVETLVLDEADRMLDMGFWPDVRRILALLPAKRQNLLFSATMASEVISVVDSVLTNPVRVETSPPAKPVDRVVQSVFPVCNTQKTDLLVELLARHRGSRTLVFTRTKHRADRVSRQLSKRGVRSEAIHGDRSQGQREKALHAFKTGRSHVLVATDVVARGIDIDRITHVVNYDIPHTAEDYVHRIGRTARAGADGNAISFLSPEEIEKLTTIEKHLNTVLACEDLEGFSYKSRTVPNPGRSARPVANSSAKPSSHRKRRGGRGRAGHSGGSSAA